MLKVTETCQHIETHGQQCPDENRDGFVFSDEFSADWNDLNQTQVLVFHSWIAEFANVDKIIDDGHGNNVVLFQSPLKHAPIGKYAKSSGWRFLIFNNKAILDAPGESVCVKKEPGWVEVSYIPLTDDQATPPVMAQLEKILTISNRGQNRARNIHLTGT